MNTGLWRNGPLLFISDKPPNQHHAGGARARSRIVQKWKLCKQRPQMDVKERLPQWLPLDAKRTNMPDRHTWRKQMKNGCGYWLIEYHGHGQACVVVINAH